VARIKKGTWVQIYKVILAPGERSSNLPPETRNVPFEMRAKGFLLEDVDIGEEARVRTVIGREIKGTLVEANPCYPHHFGKPVAELLSIGNELKIWLKEKGVR
jgi:2-amino-4-ketopentanoate thiolase alpha subunit